MLPVQRSPDTVNLELRFPETLGLGYHLDLGFNINEETSFIEGYVDGLDELEQANYHILATEQGDYLGDRGMGLRMRDLKGRNFFYVRTILPTRIKQALLREPRNREVEVPFTQRVGLDGIYLEIHVDTYLGRLVLTPTLQWGDNR